MNVGLIWQFLDEIQVSFVIEIIKSLSIEKQDVLMALGGWPVKIKSIFWAKQKTEK